MSFVDIHHHLLYGMDDDGPKTKEDMRAMIHQAVSDNISTLIATPHVSPGVRHFDQAVFHARLQEANDYCLMQALPLKILPGAELFYTSYTCELLRQGQVPTLADTDHVLVEFLPSVAAVKLEEAIRHLANAGYVTIVAHVERYSAIIKAPDTMQYLKGRYGARFQVNAETLIGKQGFWLRRYLRHALDEGLVDFIASDAHGVERRRSRMKEGAAFIEDRYGPVLARKLFNSNAAAIFAVK